MFLRFNSLMAVMAYYRSILKLTMECFNFCGYVNIILLDGTVVIYFEINVQLKGQHAFILFIIMETISYDSKNLV